MTDRMRREQWWQVVSQGQLVQTFRDREDADEFAATWNSAYPSPPYAEFTVEARDA